MGIITAIFFKITIFVSQDLISGKLIVYKALIVIFNDKYP